MTCLIYVCAACRRQVAQRLEFSLKNFFSSLLLTLIKWSKSFAVH